MTQASPWLGLALPAAMISTRRRLLARLIALPAALGLAGFAAAVQDSDGKKHKKRKKRGGKKKGNGGGNGGGYTPDGEERAFLDLINAYRRQHGAGNLSLQDQLGAAAEHHSQDMAQKNYFSHKLANGDSAEENIARFGYRDWDHVGENIAAGFETAEAVMAAWKKSAEHDRNMRNNDFDEIGIGRAYAKELQVRLVLDDDVRQPVRRLVWIRLVAIGLRLSPSCP